MLPTGKAETTALIVPRHTSSEVAGSGTSAARVSSPHVDASRQLDVTPKVNEEAMPGLGEKLWYVRPASDEEEHSDSRHMRNTSICVEAFKAAAARGYGGMPAVGRSAAFCMQRSMVTESPS